MGSVVLNQWIILVLVIYLKRFGFCLLWCMNWFMLQQTDLRLGLHIKKERQLGGKNENNQSTKNMLCLMVYVHHKDNQTKLHLIWKGLKRWHPSTRNQKPKCQRHSLSLNSLTVLISVSHTHIHRHILYPWMSCYSCTETFVMVRSLVIGQDLLIYSSTV